MTEIKRNNTKKVITALSIFALFMSIYMVFSNQRITTSMDVDVLRYASEFIETGTYGSELKLSAGIAYSPKTKLFYPQEGIGIVFPLVIFSYFSNLFSPESSIILYSFNQFFSAISVLFLFLTLSLFLTKRKAFLYTIFFGLGTPIFVHSKYFLPEPITLFAFTASIYFFFLHFRKKWKYSLFLSGLFTGSTLLCRPDAPIFYIFFILLVVTQLYKSKDDLKKYLLNFLLGVSFFTLVFAYSNFSRYGSIFETGYTLDRNEIARSLKEDITNNEAEVNKILQKAQLLYSKDQNSTETKKAIEDYRLLAGSLESQKKYLQDTEKVLRDYDDLRTIQTNGFFKYLYGIVLILIYPNRSIFFLTPFLLLLLLGVKGFYRKFKIETIIFAIIFFGYLSLYALRAPLSYAGSAAWGVRYLLPMYPLLFLLVIGYEKTTFAKSKTWRYILYSFVVLSVVFQIIGSSVNYQSIQMPLEYSCKKKFGDADMTWAFESRKSMMTDFSSSLLLNNARILTGNLNQDQIEYRVETGANDWFFYQVV
ncbi:MAG: hypothetical protein KAS62_09290, partial [Candidatus Delongbacteria bacterium]|nr:hypothetical protein [Candidatus Delongbacteria bacterium]